MRYTIYKDPHRVLDRDFFGESFINSGKGGKV